jgi:hypothetical protein
LQASQDRGDILSRTAQTIIGKVVRWINQGVPENVM